MRTARRVVKNGEDSYTVTYRSGSDGPEQQMEVGLVMMATGRHPRVSGLNLQVGVASVCVYSLSVCVYALNKGMGSKWHSQ